MKLLAFPVVCALALAGALAPDLAQAPADQNTATDAARAAFPAHQRHIMGAFTTMPQEKYSFKPTPELMTFGELAVHIGVREEGDAGGCPARSRLWNGPSLRPGGRLPEAQRPPAADRHD